MTEGKRQNIIGAVRAIHARGEYPSRGRVKAELHKNNLSAEVNEVRLSEIRRLGLEVIVKKAGYIE